jgi:hypothetical protein
MAHEVVIGQGCSRRVFLSKKEAKTFCREMLASYRNNENISEDDSLFLAQLLERHPEAQHKIGCGVKRFFRAGTGMGTDCFWLERVDSSTTDFSFVTCVDAKGQSLYQDFAEACRQSVQTALDEAKKRHFEKYGDEDGKVTCDLTGEKVGPKEAHLDHKKPMTFQVIVTTFLKANQIEIRADMLLPPGDRQFAVTFADKELEERFRKYHGSIASLRIIKAAANLSLGGSERLTNPKSPVLLR